MLPQTLTLERSIRAEDFIANSTQDLLRALKLSHPELKPVREALDAGHEEQAIHAFAKYYRQRRFDAKIFQVAVDWVFLNLTGTAKDPHFNHSTAEDYLAGRLFDGYLKYDLQGKPLDWHHTPLPCLTRFPLVPAVLRSAYHSGDPRYVRFIVDHSASFMKAWPLESFIGQNTINYDKTSSVTEAWHWGQGHSRLRIWVEILVQLRNNPHLTDEELVAILFRMVQETRFLMYHVQFHVDKKHNSGGAMLLTLMYVCEVLSDFMEVDEWRARVAKMAVQFIQSAFYPDGMFKELTTGYSSELSYTMQILAYGVRDQPEMVAQREHLRQLVTAMVALTHPSGRQPMYGDSWRVDTQEWLYPPLVQWLGLDWAMPVEPGKTRPEPPFTAWPTQGQDQWCGYYTMCSDWSKQANAMMIDGGPWGLSHMHCDRLSFTLSAIGKEFIIDPGNSTYNSSDPKVRISMLEAGFMHSTVTVDGVDEFIKPPHWWETEEPLNNLWQHTNRYTLFAGEFHFEPVKAARWQRRVLFVDGLYWLLQDVITADQASADIEQNFQFATDIQVQFEGQTTIASSPEGTRLLIVPVQSSLQPTLTAGDTQPHSTYTTVWCASTTRREFDLGRGWATDPTGRYGVIPAPAVTYTGKAGLPAIFTSLLIPLPQGKSLTDIPQVRTTTQGSETTWHLPSPQGGLVFVSSVEGCRVVE